MLKLTEHRRSVAGRSKLRGYSMSSDKPVNDRTTLSVPKAEGPSPEEIIRRMALIQELDRLRAEVGPIDLSLEELMQEDEDECG